MKHFLRILFFLLLTNTANSQVSKSINLSTAGTLTTLLTSEEKNTITTLIISGNIDASDIKCIRVEIANLNYLDLSNANITAYNGTGGTTSTVTSYPADEMPTYSFYSTYTGAKVSLRTIIFPSTLKSIGSYSFYLCTGLTGNLVLPSSLISIQDYAFYRCTGLTGTLILPNSVTSTGNSTFYYCNGLTGLKLSDSLTSVGNYVFQYCGNLTGNLSIPNTVTSIGYSAFNGCKITGSLILPNSLTNLNDYAFNGCTGLTSVTIPNSLSIIGPSVFLGCSGLTTVTIGSSVHTIREFAFSSCTNLKTIYCLNSNPPVLGDRCFILVTPTSVYVPAASITAYKAAPGWSDYFSSVIKALNTALPIETIDVVKMYPNPCTDNIRIMGIKDNVLLEIFDVHGRNVITKQIVNDESISLNMLEKGVYITKITGLTGTIKKRIVKE